MLVCAKVTPGEEALEHLEGWIRNQGTATHMTKDTCAQGGTSLPCFLSRARGDGNALGTGQVGPGGLWGGRPFQHLGRMKPQGESRHRSPNHFDHKTSFGMKGSTFSSSLRKRGPARPFPLVSLFTPVPGTQPGAAPGLPPPSLTGRLPLLRLPFVRRLPLTPAAGRGGAARVRRSFGVAARRGLDLGTHRPRHTPPPAAGAHRPRRPHAPRTDQCARSGVLRRRGCIFSPRQPQGLAACSRR